ncbi:MAG: SRPBCC domain-containing protein [Chloroflexota bacterium]
MENDFAPILHHQFTFRMKPQRGWDGITHCEVLELEPLKRVAFSYRGRASGEKTLSCAGIDSERTKAAVKGIFTDLDTMLRFTLTPEAACDGQEKTRLLMEHTGFKGLKLVLVSYVMGAGWKKILDHRLPPVLDGIQE